MRNHGIFPLPLWRWPDPRSVRAGRVPGTREPGAGTGRGFIICPFFSPPVGKKGEPVPRPYAAGRRQ